MSQQPGNGTKTLQRRRREIDVLDSELLRLLNRRAQIAFELAAVKKSSRLPVYDGTREQQILSRIRRENQGPLDSESIEAIFRCIIRESRRVEESSMQRLNHDYFEQEKHHGHQHGGKRLRS